MSEARRLRQVEAPPVEEQGPAGSPASDGEDEILTAREAQKLLKIGRTKLWDLTRRNEFPAYRVGRGNRSSLRYKRRELLRWLEGNRISGPDR